MDASASGAAGSLAADVSSAVSVGDDGESSFESSECSAGYSARCECESDDSSVYWVSWEASDGCGCKCGV